MIKHQQRQPLWTAEQEIRLIEMYRSQYTLEEIAREISLPVDEVEAHIDELALEGDTPQGYT